MNLDQYMDKTGFSTKDLELLPSVGCVINTKNGDTFPLMSDDSIGFDEPMNVVEMWIDQFRSLIIITKTLDVINTGARFSNT